MNERLLGLGCEHLPVLIVHTHVGVQPHGQQGHHHVQLGVRAGEVVLLREETLLGEAAVDEDVPQLSLGLPHDPQRRHVQLLLVAEPHLGLLAALARVLPAVEGVEGGEVVAVPRPREVALPRREAAAGEVRHEDLGAGGAGGGDGGEGVARAEHGAQHHHLAQHRLHGQPGQDAAEGGQLEVGVDGEHLAQHHLGLDDGVYGRRLHTLGEELAHGPQLEQLDGEGELV